MPSTNVIVDALILAAGMSRRMGEQNKLLTTFRGKSLIRHVVDSLAEATLRHLFVVIGFEANRMRQELKDQPVRFIPNPHFAQGMMSSIVAGIDQVIKEAPDGLMICLGDMPLLATSDYQTCIQTFAQDVETNERIIVRASYQVQPGHPIIFSRHFFSELLRGDGLEDKGAQHVIHQHLHQVVLCDISHSGCLIDFDTPEDFNTQEQLS